MENKIKELEEKLLCKEQECFQLANVYHGLVKIANHRLNKIEDLQQQLDQLKKTLGTIKEICNNNDELQGNFNLVDCDKYKLGKHNLANKIIQKISECEEINANI